MTKSNANPKVDIFLSKAEKWREETETLRKMLLGFPLTEELKWGKPCYSFQESNIVIIIGLKETCALMFCKGALLKDANGLLTKPGANTQAGRWLKFTSLQEITKQKSFIKAYVQEAIDAEKAGLKITFKKVTEFTVPEELQKKLDTLPTFKKAFSSLTPGRQRGYLLYFSGAKQSKTREARVEKCLPQILEGKGLND